MEKEYEILPISKFLKERKIKKVIVYSRSDNKISVVDLTENEKIGTIDLTKDENFYDVIEEYSRQGLITISLDSEDMHKDEEIHFYKGYAIVINKSKDNLLIRLKILKFFQEQFHEWKKENKVDTWLFFKLMSGKISENVLKKIVRLQTEEWTYLKI